MSKPANQEPDDLLENDVVETLRSSGDKDVEELVQVLGNYDHIDTAAQEVLTSLSSSKDKRVALLSVSLLLRTGSDTEHLYPMYVADLLGMENGARPDIGDIGWLLTSRANIASIDGLEKLSDSSHVDIRQGAMRAIRKLRDPQTTEFLVRKLDSADTDVQYLALITLAEIYGMSGDYAPGMGPFEQDRQKYVSLWKRWAYNRHG